jgi:DNA repair ATPase RecN
MQDIERGAAAAGETVNRNHQMIALEPCHHELVAKFSQYRCYQALTVKYQSLASILMSADINEEQQQSIAARMEEISTLVQSYRSQIQHGSIGSHRMPGYKLSQHVVVFQLPHQSRQRIAIGWRCDDFSQ